MTSPGDIMKQESLPLGETATLTKETARGFHDRAGRFQIDQEGGTLADRWRSAFFNVRDGDQENRRQGEDSSALSSEQERAREVHQGHFTLRTETVQGIVGRGGRFNGSGEGGTLGDRLVSDWFNFREAQQGAEG